MSELSNRPQRTDSARIAAGTTRRRRRWSPSYIQEMSGRQPTQGRAARPDGADHDPGRRIREAWRHPMPRPVSSIRSPPAGRPTAPLDRARRSCASACS